MLLAAAAQFEMRWLSLRAATRFHNDMLTSLLYAPLSFFHSNPSGRIINRFTKDTSDIDRNLASFAASWFQSLLQLLSTAALIGTVTPFVLPFLVPILLLFGLLYLYFQASVREIKRLDALARSPIFTSVGNALTVRCFFTTLCCARCARKTCSRVPSTPLICTRKTVHSLCHTMSLVAERSLLNERRVCSPLRRSFACQAQLRARVQGIATIKSFRREAMHEARMRALVDGSSVMQLCNQSMNRWLALRLEAVGACVSFAAAAMAIEQRGDAAWVGLTLSYALQMTSLTTMAVRCLGSASLLRGRLWTDFVDIVCIRAARAIFNWRGA